MSNGMSRRSWLATTSVVSASLCAKAMGTESLGSRAAASDWTSWRGASRDGLVPSVNWPSNFAGLKKAWTIDLSDSYSGPIVAGDRVYTTETIQKRDESLVALDRQSGTEIWRRQWKGAMTVPFFAARNGSWIRSTPAIAGDRIIVGGMKDVVACFEASTGKELWRVDYVKDHGATLPSFGLVCSPLIDGEFVYMQAGGAVRKLRVSDGGTEWEALADQGGMYGGAFSSPIIATIHGVRQLVVQTRTTLGGVELETGRVIWQKDIASFRGMNILTPTIWNDKVFTSSYGGRAQLLELDPSSWAVKEVWDSKAEAYMSSPIVVGDHLYMHLKNKRFACVDLASGKETWRTTPFGQYWSMLSNGENILALDERGELLLIDANPTEFTILDRKKVSDEPSWAHVAMAGSQIYVRRLKGLDAYDWQA